jgi:hypothetical protein
MGADIVSFTGPLRVWQTGKFRGMSYMRIEGDAAEAIGTYEVLRRLELGRRRGFTSVKVEAAIGDSSWSTSVFPTKDGGWFLPIKQAICRAEGLKADQQIGVRLELL